MVADQLPGYPTGSGDRSAPVAATLILASGSVTRARLLRAADVAFVIEVPVVDEATLRAGASDGAKAAGIIAAAKASAVSARHADAWVIGSDQVLACEGTLLGKPGDRPTARRQLEMLSGRAHRLVTSVTVARGGQAQWQHAEVAELVMRRLSAAAIDCYLADAGDEVLGSPGAYHLEGLGASLFETVRGDYFSILGLPLLPLLAYLRSQKAIPE